MAEKIPFFNISKYFARIVSSQFSVCIVCSLQWSPGKKWLWSYGQKSGITSKMRMCHHHHHSISGFCPVLMKKKKMQLHHDVTNCVYIKKCVLCYFTIRVGKLNSCKVFKSRFCFVKECRVPPTIYGAHEAP